MKEERFSSGTPLKNKISDFGAISPLYPNFVYHSLSLSQFEEKLKSRRDIYIRGLFNYYMFWHFKSVYNCSKGIHVLLCYHVVYVIISCFLSSFYSPYVILLRIVLSIPKISHGKPGVADYYNIILLRLRPIGPYSSIVEGKEV